MRARSLRAIMATFVVVFLIAIFAIRVINYRVAHTALAHEVDRRLAGEIDEVIAISNGVANPAMIRWIKAELDDHESADLYFMLIDRYGRQLAGNLRLRPPPPIGFSDLGEMAKIPGLTHGRALARALADGGRLVVVSDNDSLHAFDSLMFRIQLTGLIVTVLIFLAGVTAVAMAISGRMRTMQRTVDAVIAGNLHSRVPLDGTNSEFDRQAAAFNRMMDRIDALMTNVKHAAKDVAHELKSPLARLRSRIAAVARQSEGERLAPDVADILSQTDQIIDLFSSLLRLWEIEGGHRRERFAPLDLRALIGEVAESLDTVAEESDRQLLVAAGRPLPMRGELNLLRQMLVNLIENAIRHTPIGTRIEVSATQRADGVRIAIADNGLGIPTEAHALVVSRFGRLEAAGHLPGQGLGLTLVEAIVRLHDGTMRLEDAGPGLRVVIDLPGHG
ncbi:ATP-binding protein [Sphingomonas sp. 28-63-12]|uniref:sensor histidine kinase n=1 Tax=Sphingomonas sp. 28-63-12 TaxID=1970434 RepID=UPI000BC95925|nr:MAG: two-component sensor histidine kinase [Sphingomonas sp. 28-63-12]